MDESASTDAARPSAAARTVEAVSAGAAQVATRVADAQAQEPAGTARVTEDVSDPALYINRELSWLDFNDRVLQLAEDDRVPLLERVKFCAIYTTNLDEYYMVRVAGLHDQIDAGVENPTQDGLIPSQTIALIREHVLRQGRRLADCFEGRLRPELAAQGIRIVSVADLDERQREQLARHFQRAIFPALTPLAVAPGRPFPYISNLSLSLAVLVRDPAGGESAPTVFARVKVPTEILPRFVSVEEPDGSGAAAGAVGGPHRPPPGRALPGHGDPRLRRLPGHPRR